MLVWATRIGVWSEIMPLLLNLDIDGVLKLAALAWHKYMAYRVPPVCAAVGAC